MILDRTLRLPENLHVFDSTIPTIVFTEKQSESKANLEFITIDFQNLINEINSFCYSKQIQSIIVEGGSRLLSTYINSGIWDEARIFKGEITFGGGIKAPELNKIQTSQVNLNKSILYFTNNNIIHK